MIGSRSSIVFMTAMRGSIATNGGDANTYKIHIVPDNNDTHRSNDIISNEIIQIIFCIWYATVFVLGVLGNVLVCYVVLRNRAMQTVTNIFITNLALSDILLCILAVPFTPLYTFMGRWAFGQTLCHLVSFAQGCSIYISTLTLTSIAIDRYIVIIHPFHPRMKLFTCLTIIVSIWMIALIATLPYGMYMKVVLIANPFNPNNNNNNPNNNNNNNDNNDNNDNNFLTTHNNNYNNRTTTTTTTTTASIGTAAGAGAAAASTLIQFDSLQYTTPIYIMMENSTNDQEIFVSYCEENWPSEHYRKVFGSVTTILQFVLPFIIISICYTWISCKLNARAKSKPGTKTSRKEETDRDRKRRTNRMLIAMVAVFGCSWLPLNLVNIFDDFYAKSNEWRFYTLFFFVAHSIAMSSTCYNPFLYAWLNENFRKEFKHALPCFQAANSNFISITQAYAGSIRNKRHLFGQSNRHTAGICTHGSSLENNDDHENGITQDTCTTKDKLYQATNEFVSTATAAATVSASKVHFAKNLPAQSDSDEVTCQPAVEILLNDKQIIINSTNSSLLHRYDETQFMDNITPRNTSSTNNECFTSNTSLQFTTN